MGAIAIGTRQTAKILAVLAGSLFVPLLLWAGVVIGFRCLYLEWKAIRRGLFSGRLACAINEDCPPGYICIDGKCVPFRG
jgi:hypothetical protein